MRDINSLPGPGSADVIDMDNRQQIEYWADQFGVTAVVLLKGIKEVGKKIADLQKYAESYISYYYYTMHVA